MDPFPGEADAQDAFAQDQTLTTDAHRSSAEHLQTVSNPREEPIESEEFPTFDHNLQPEPDRPWPLPAPQQFAATHYRLQHSASTPFLHTEVAGPSTRVPRRRLAPDAQAPFTDYNPSNLTISIVTPTKSFLRKLQDGFKNVFRGKTKKLGSAYTRHRTMTSARRMASIDAMVNQGTIDDARAGPSEPSPPRETTIAEKMYQSNVNKAQAGHASSSLHHEAPFADQMNQLTIDAQAGPSSSSPRREATTVEPAPVEQDNDNWNLYSDPRDEDQVTVRGAHAKPSSSEPEQSAGEVDSEEEEDLLPAEREARDRGLTDIDFSAAKAMNAESEASDTIVRVYDDVSSDVVASRADKPIYDGKSISNNGVKSIGQFRCCFCKEVQDLFKIDQGEHLVTALSECCFHHSCDGCILTGNIKIYKPVQEPIPVQLSDEQKQILFGVFCSGCGKCWRAQEVKSSVVDKISAVPAKLGAASIDKIRGSRSTHNLCGGEPSNSKSTLNLRQLSNEMEKEHGQQAGHALVKFSGIKCTCGSTSDGSSLGCQIVESKDEEVVGGKKPSTFTGTPDDRARGIGKAFLTMVGKDGKRVRHANPLASCPPGPF